MASLDPNKQVGDPKAVAADAKGVLPIIDLAAHDAGQLPGSKVLDDFKAGLNVLGNQDAPVLSRRRAFISNITLIEMISDPHIWVGNSHGTIEKIAEHARSTIERQSLLLQTGRSVDDEARIFRDVVNQNMPDVLSAFHARSAIAAAVAECSRLNGFDAGGIILDPNQSPPAPIHLRLRLERHQFVFGVDSKGMTLITNISDRAHMIALDPIEWLDRVIAEHREALRDMPDKQVGLILLQLEMRPGDTNIRRQLLQQLEEAGREDEALRQRRAHGSGSANGF